MLYRAEVGDGLTEHEYDHLFAGLYSKPVNPNPEEASEARYVPLNELEEWMRSSRKTLPCVSPGHAAHPDANRFNGG
jgi:isopentenyldiphosphate isomerase